MITLLADIEAFLAHHNYAPSRFGADAIGDRHFVRQVRAGRRVWPETEAKIRTFMAEFSPVGVAPPPFPTSSPRHRRTAPQEATA